MCFKLSKKIKRFLLHFMLYFGRLSLVWVFRYTSFLIYVNNVNNQDFKKNAAIGVRKIIYFNIFFCVQYTQTYGLPKWFKIIMLNIYILLCKTEINFRFLNRNTNFKVQTNIRKMSKHFSKIKNYVRLS